MKCTDQILAKSRINAGFAANGRIDHRKQRRRNLQKRNATQIDRRSKSRQIADNSAAESDDGVGA